MVQTGHQAAFALRKGSPEDLKDSHLTSDPSNGPGPFHGRFGARLLFVAFAASETPPRLASLTKPAPAVDLVLSSGSHHFGGFVRSSAARGGDSCRFRAFVSGFSTREAGRSYDSDVSAIAHLHRWSPAVALVVLRVSGSVDSVLIEMDLEIDPWPKRRRFVISGIDFLRPEVG
jgi:hypothetical protein